MTDLPALTAAREWAAEHVHPQPDDRMLRTYGAALLRDLADFIDQEPSFPLPAGTVAELVRERADDLDPGRSRPGEGARTQDPAGLAWDDCAAVADALIAAPGSGEIWRSTYGDIVGAPLSLARVAVEALTKAGRIAAPAEQGRLGPPDGHAQGIDVDDLLANVARSLTNADNDDERAEAIEMLLNGWYAAWPDEALADPTAPLAAELVRLLRALGRPHGPRPGQEG